MVGFSKTSTFKTERRWKDEKPFKWPQEILLESHSGAEGLPVKQVCRQERPLWVWKMHQVQVTPHLEV
ncbi:MAG: hypothetical protein A3E32_02415 [Candidatus Zambryskibacteria bacterium RIFCSPHIGHO2_12_FULL_38_37]|uniref:Uncharacterized protein n=1 Tax=Candidatus Zambryskibacteria bacterium RIFCSPHIGHO2_12_FULL_38_37 TaxID=1802751 RepID=A0A1G2TPN9_9BACT|nr:MAG: hypothetical protein A3C63_01380 [Candidatus Zambryskibacteria bacterium RIFCSPHIGHO2_02_FULL_39_82]OHA99275.1 MAG: hypothetical protein A3E32_02415 [Candidatus Zambryskibacteria bacterium RIFCSPHIGHO2_12_FULL_38_37]